MEKQNSLLHRLLLVIHTHCLGLAFYILRLSDSFIFFNRSVSRCSAKLLPDERKGKREMIQTGLCLVIYLFWERFLFCCDSLYFAKSYFGAKPIERFFFAFLFYLLECVIMAIQINKMKDFFLFLVSL